MNDEVAWLACGGTIDKIYHDKQDDYRIGAPASDAILQRARVATATAQPLVAKDSLEMTDKDRQAVVAAILASPARRLVITHGTDTLTDTAQSDSRSRARQNRRYWSAPSSPPFSRDSDADFNIGFALAAAKTLPPGNLCGDERKPLPRRRGPEKPASRALRSQERLLK